MKQFPILLVLTSLNSYWWFTFFILFIHLGEDFRSPYLLFSRYIPENKKILCACFHWRHISCGAHKTSINTREKYYWPVKFTLKERYLWEMSKIYLLFLSIQSKTISDHKSLRETSINSYFILAPFHHQNIGNKKKRYSQEVLSLKSVDSSSLAMIFER